MDALVNMSQALQQTVMSLEVLLQRKLVSENTAREMLRSVFGRFFQRMKGSDQEALDAQGNLDLEAQLAKLQATLQPPPVDKTQGNGSGNKNKVPAISGRNKGGANE